MHRSVLLGLVPFGILVVVTQAQGRIGHAALAVSLRFSVFALYHTFTAPCPRCRTGLPFNLMTFWGFESHPLPQNYPANAAALSDAFPGSDASFSTLGAVRDILPTISRLLSNILGKGTTVKHKDFWKRWQLTNERSYILLRIPAALPRCGGRNCRSAPEGGWRCLDETSTMGSSASERPSNHVARVRRSISGQSSAVGRVPRTRALQGTGGSNFAQIAGSLNSAFLSDYTVTTVCLLGNDPFISNQLGDRSPQLDGTLNPEELGSPFTTPAVHCAHSHGRSLSSPIRIFIGPARRPRAFCS
jgi:hypothetical protein